MTRRWRQIAGALAGSGALALGFGACGDDEPDRASTTPQPAQEEAPAGGSVEQPQPVTGGSTTLRLDRSALDVLGAAGVDMEPLGPATEEDGRFRFPISGGSIDIDTPSGTIEHEGGLRFSAAGQHLDARDLAIEPGDGVLTAEVAGERVPLLAADLDAVTVPTDDRVVLPGRAAALSAEVIPALEEELGVDLPDADLPLGRLEVSAET